jgi:hypothetical protein
MGRGIDMTLFPEGTTFNTVVTTKDFQCIEMQTKRPWTYQVTWISRILIIIILPEILPIFSIPHHFLPNTLKLIYFISIGNQFFQSYKISVRFIVLDIF